MVPPAPYPSRRLDVARRPVSRRFARSAFVFLLRGAINTGSQLCSQQQIGQAASPLGKGIVWVPLAQSSQGQSMHGLSHLSHQSHFAPGRHLSQMLDLQVFDFGWRIRCQGCHIAYLRCQFFVLLVYTHDDRLASPKRPLFPLERGRGWTIIGLTRRLARRRSSIPGEKSKSAARVSGAQWMVPRRGLEPPRLERHRPSTCCVCQFRHRGANIPIITYSHYLSTQPTWRTITLIC